MTDEIERNTGFETEWATVSSSILSISFFARMQRRHATEGVPYKS